MTTSTQTSFVDNSALMLRAVNIGKTFTLHGQGGVRIEALTGVSLDVERGECVVLVGPSGAGKSTFMRCLYGNYLASTGTIAIRDDAQETKHLSITGAEPLVIAGVERDDARRRAADLLRRLNIPQRLWPLPPATFSGGEQQRVNIARGFISDLPLLLLDEPTASLDAGNRAVVVDLVAEKKRRGTAVVAIVHDDDVRAGIADTVIDVNRFTAAA